MHSGPKAVISCLTSVSDHRWSEHLCETITYKNCKRLHSSKEMQEEYPTFTLDIVNGPGVDLEGTPMLIFLGIDVTSQGWKGDLERIKQFTGSGQLHKGSMLIALGYNPGKGGAPANLDEIKKAFEAENIEFIAQNFDPKSLEKFFPAMPKELLEMWFGKTFNPEGLDARTRFLVTIAALTVLGPVGEPQLRMAIKNGLSAGATKREVAEVIWQMSMFGGVPAMQKALEIAQAVFAEVEEKDA